MKALLLAFVLSSVAISTSRADVCQNFSASTLNANGVAPAKWRTDYPSRRPSAGTQPWESFNFRERPVEYMSAVLAEARKSFRIVDRRLVGTGQEDWWISLWLDYGNSGREPLMGLTKERGPDKGDLSPSSQDGHQVWAVGFYNRSGAAVLGDIFAEPCNPSLPVSVNFPADTASIKFLFTDAPPTEVTYLQGGPEFDAFIDPAGAGTGGQEAKNRTKRTVRLLQVDIAVKDTRSSETQWVFGTFVWQGPPKGDTLFDNLVPVSLQWGNDPQVYDTALQQTWINPNLRDVTYGWASRPTMGFLGRANGPADNIRSSCLSCHAAARTPRASIGILNSRFDMENSVPARVKEHVDTWFQNIDGRALFQPHEPAVSTLDYSLQLEVAVSRMCTACRIGDLRGTTPSVCRSSGLYNRPQCNAPIPAGPLRQSLEAMPPARQ